MKDLGIYTTKNGKEYTLHFLPELNIAQAIGPLSYNGIVSEVAYEEKAESEAEARQKLIQAIEEGNI